MIGHIRIEIPIRKTSEEWNPQKAVILIPDDLTKEEAEKLKRHIDSCVLTPSGGAA